LSILRFLYYRLYSALLKTNLKDVAEHVAAFYLVGLLCTNLIVILNQLGFSPVGSMSFKEYALILFIPLYLVIYILFVYKKRFLDIVERYKDETKHQRVRGNLVLLAYVVITFCAVFFFRKSMNGLKLQSKPLTPVMAIIGTG
jgi:hypothetical protein